MKQIMKLYLQIQEMDLMMYYIIYTLVIQFHYLMEQHHITLMFLKRYSNNKLGINTADAMANLDLTTVTFDIKYPDI
jgi:hypothetical protein